MRKRTGQRILRAFCPFSFRSRARLLFRLYCSKDASVSRFRPPSSPVKSYYRSLTYINKSVHNVYYLRIIRLYVSRGRNGNLLVYFSPNIYKYSYLKPFFVPLENTITCFRRIFASRTWQTAIAAVRCVQVQHFFVQPLLTRSIFIGVLSIVHSDKFISFIASTDRVKVALRFRCYYFKYIYIFSFPKK